MTNSKAIEVKVKPVTTIFTGDIYGKSKDVRLTGIIGSIRWWMEALVRGLGGFACDPTESNPKKTWKKCDFKLSKDVLKKTKSYKKTMKQSLEEVCPVCQFFGCGGLSSAVRWNIKEGQIRGDRDFTLQLIPTRKVTPELWWLFEKTLYIIEKYGSIGGKTADKPYDKSHYKNYGLVKFETDFSHKNSIKYDQVVRWLSGQLNRTSEDSISLPNLTKFWFVKGDFLMKNLINKFLKLTRKGNTYEKKEEREFHEFLRGSRNGDSKKIFSFNKKGYERMWGYVRSSDNLPYDKLKNKKVKSGREIFGELKGDSK